ncbi:MAG TPA: phytanoyl-CoA dioxygenase family protein [Fimbriimonadaceae bacterium]|nr:phytanoyl-CoA dioxygenase family protein [Fimbriimonadaceae bacterium]
MGSIVTDRHRAEMDSNGFTVFERLFTEAEMADLTEVFEVHERRRQAQLRAEGDSGISRADEITFNDHLAENDPSVRAFCERPEIVEVCRAFLGPNVDLYWNQTVFKQPEGDKIFPWHQDDAYTEVDPAPYLTLWLAISDATEENGCISVLPGSHKGGLRPHEWTDIGLTGYPADAPDQGISVPVPAGSLIAFWSMTLHKSGANRSKGIRRAFVIQYCHAGLRYKASGDVVPNLLPISREEVTA